MDADTSETERTRQAVQQAQRARATARSATAPSSRQEAAERIRNQQIQDEVKSRVLARAVATATPDALARCESKRILLHGAEADEAMKSRPTRPYPAMFESPHEAAPSFHIDWTLVPGSRDDVLKKEYELRLRDARNRLLR